LDSTEKTIVSSNLEVSGVVAIGKPRTLAYATPDVSTHALRKWQLQGEREYAAWTSVGDWSYMNPTPTIEHVKTVAATLRDNWKGPVCIARWNPGAPQLVGLNEQPEVCKVLATFVKPTTLGEKIQRACWKASKV
jgi:hypothetical protein